MNGNIRSTVVDGIIEINPTKISWHRTCPRFNRNGNTSIVDSLHGVYGQGFGCKFGSYIGYIVGADIVEVTQ